MRNIASRVYANRKMDSTQKSLARMSRQRGGRPKWVCQAAYCPAFVYKDEMTFDILLSYTHDINRVKCSSLIRNNNVLTVN